MGYFSQLAITMQERSIREKEPSLDPRERLLIRIEELKEQLAVIRQKPESVPYGDYEVFLDRYLQHPILRYVLPEDLHSRDEIQSALMLAENDLAEIDPSSVTSVVFLIPGQMYIRSVISHCH